jgi:diguanylate cyclase (GGDEF)-like protein
MFEKIVDIVAPRNALDLLLKVAILIGSFTVFDYYVCLIAFRFFEPDLAVELTITTFIAAPFGFFVMGIMSVQRRLKERLHEYAQTDQLTGLLNRQAFLNEARDVFGPGGGGTVLMIDVDHFKSVNDTHGHFVGDICLRQVGEHLRACTRSTDIVGRIGGEEFVVVMPDTNVEIADKISARICAPITIDAVEDFDADLAQFEITMSVGGVMSLPGQDLTELMRHADVAMYHAKDTGRARVVFFGRGSFETKMAC